VARPTAMADNAKHEKRTRVRMAHSGKYDRVTMVVVHGVDHRKHDVSCSNFRLP
jgi:hypothetical protein